MNGRLEDRSPADVLHAVQRQRAGGILRLQDSRAIRQLFIDPGAMIRLAVSDHPDESLTSLFREEGGVSEPSLQQAAAAKRPNELLGTTLIRLGLISPELLARLTASHIRRVLRAALSMDSGTFEYQGGEFPYLDQMSGGVSAAEMLLEWSRGLHDVEWLRSRLGSPETLLRRATRPPEGYRNVPLDANEGYTMSRVDGTTTLGEICLVSPLGEEVTLRALLGLMLSGIIEMPDHESVPATSPAARAPGAPPARPPGPPPAGPPAARPRTAAPTGGAAGRPAPAAAPPVSGRAVATPATGPVAAPPAARPASAPAAAPSPAPRAKAPAAPPPPGPPRLARPVVERVGPSTASSLETEMLERHERLREQTLYDVLGIQPTAKPGEMRHAYYGLARRFHPDKFRREELKAKAEQVFGRITEAYSTLSSAESRKKYDEDIAQRGAARRQEKSVDATDLARLNFKRGKELYDRGKFGEALPFLQNACDQDPSRAEHLRYLALTQSKNPRWKKQAEENFLKAIELSPSHADTYAHLGTHYARGGLHSKARELYEQALQWDAGNEEALKGLAPDKDEQKGFLGIFGRK